MSKISNKSKNRELRSFGDHHRFLSRIKKTLYYGKLPTTDTLSLPVTELASELFSEPRRANRSLERLHCKDAATISRRACISPCSLVLAMLYLDRLKTRNPTYLECVIPSELFLVSLMVSSKFLQDFGEEDEVFMDEWAASGGVSVSELIELEREFLSAIEWEVFVQEPTFWAKLRSLEFTLAKREGSNRGFYTYTELENLFTAIDTRNLINSLATVIAVFTAAYTMGVLTMVSAVFVASNVSNALLIKTQGNMVTDDIVINNNNMEMGIFNQAEQNSSEMLDVSNQILADLSLQQNKHNMSAIDVLQTSIILASIKSTNPKLKETLLDPNDTISENTTNTEAVTWDWWSNPVMEWLTETSKSIETWTFILNTKPYIQDRYKEMSLATYKWFGLQDQVHRATKIRIQDQLERTWHMEWTDSVCNMLVGLDYNSNPIHGANFQKKGLIIGK